MSRENVPGRECGTSKDSGQRKNQGVLEICREFSDTDQSSLGGFLGTGLCSVLETGIDWSYAIHNLGARPYLEIMKSKPRN